MRLAKRMTLPITALAALALPAPTGAADPRSAAHATGGVELGANDRGCRQAADRVMAIQRRHRTLVERLTRARVRLRNARRAARRARGTAAARRTRRRVQRRRRVVKRIELAIVRTNRRLKRATLVLQRECS